MLWLCDAHEKEMVCVCISVCACVCVCVCRTYISIYVCLVGADETPATTAWFACPVKMCMHVRVRDRYS